MRVKELIAKLQTLDPDLPVLALTEGYDQWHIASEVRSRNVVQVCNDDHPAPFANGGKPLGKWFVAVEIR